MSTTTTHASSGAGEGESPTDLAARFEAKREECEAAIQGRLHLWDASAAFLQGRSRAFAEARDMARAGAAGGADGFVLVPRKFTTEMRAAGARAIKERATDDQWARMLSMEGVAAENAWPAMVAAAPPPPAQQGSSSPPLTAERVDLGELERLSDEATTGDMTATPYSDGEGGCWLSVDGMQIAAGLPDEDGAYITALWNGHRARHLVPASLPAGTGSAEEGTDLGAPATPSGSQASPEAPSDLRPTGVDPSRGEVDYDDLNRLFAQMPEGPWHPLRTGDSYEIRQIDTDPTNKHHWPFRLCQSIAGQRAGCDDAVFAFLAGVLNAWPAIAEANSDEAYIKRVLAMPEDELRKRFLVDGQSPEQAETISRQAFNLAVLKVALTQIHDQYIINRGDMTDAEALGAIKKIAAKALAGEARSAETGTGSVHEHAAPQGATPTPDPVGEAKALLERLDPRLTPEQHIRRLREGADDAMEPYVATAFHAHADRIRAALATLHASQDQAGEVRS